MAGERIVKAMQNVNNTTKLPKVVYGVVVTVDPIAIQLEEKPLKLTGDFISLSPLCKRKTITATAITQNNHTHAFGGSVTGAATVGGESGSISGTATGTTAVEKADIVLIELWRGLQAGDRVKMLELDKAQHYYVLQREGEL